jgi:hypothetical protein
LKYIFILGGMVGIWVAVALILAGISLAEANGIRGADVFMAFFGCVIGGLIGHASWLIWQEHRR